MSAKARILLVEDEAGLVMTLTDRLESEGYACESAGDAIFGLTLAKDPRFDLVLLDVMLPGGSGLELCKDLRAAGVETPVLMLTARSQLVDRVVGLKLGADDYLCKPFEASELMARIEALLRRSKYGKDGGCGIPTGTGTVGGRLDFEGFSVDFDRALVIREGAELPLSAQEYKLLAWFVGHKGDILSREALLDAVWEYGAEVTSRTVDVHVAWLRQKIGDSASHPRHISTVRGLGYRFVQ